MGDISDTSYTPYTPIIGTLGYVLSPDRRQVLLVERTRENDQQRGKYNGLGGKLERDEDVVSGFRRELREESGLEAISLRLRATISWPGFGVNGEDWLGFVFVIDEYEGTPPERNDDGPLIWADIDHLTDLPMWEGDRLWLPLVLGDGPQIHGVMPYVNGRPASWSYTELGL